MKIDDFPYHAIHEVVVIGEYTHTYGIKYALQLQTKRPNLLNGMGISSLDNIFQAHDLMKEGGEGSRRIASRGSL